MSAEILRLPETAAPISSEQLQEEFLLDLVTFALCLPRTVRAKLHAMIHLTETAADVGAQLAFEPSGLCRLTLVWPLACEEVEPVAGAGTKR